jgi:hypothetical protein
MASDANGWPATPGVPENPERDGWHWLMQDTVMYPARWDAAATAWHRSRFLTPREITRLNDYGGPCLLPSEVAAREAAARRAGIEAALAAAEAVPLPHTENSACPGGPVWRTPDPHAWPDAIVADIRALLEEPGA